MDIKKSLKQLVFLSVIFFVSILISNIVKFYISDEILEAILGQRLVISVVLSTLLGIILPLPKFATYPLAFALYEKGAFISAACALIWGEIIISDIANDLIEIKYFGKKYWLIRMLVMVMLIIPFSLVLEVVL